MRLSFRPTSKSKARQLAAKLSEEAAAGWLRLIFCSKWLKCGNYHRGKHAPRANFHINDLREWLDPLQQAAEAAHDMFGRFNRRQFTAKYGGLPKGYLLKGHHETSILRLFLYPHTSYGSPAFMPDELAMRLRDFVPMPEPATLPTEDELPDAVQRAERAALDPKQTSGRVHRT